MNNEIVDKRRAQSFQITNIEKHSFKKLFSYGPNTSQISDLSKFSTPTLPPIQTPKPNSLANRKLTFCTFGFKNSEVVESTKIRHFLGGVHEKKTMGSMGVSELWTQSQMRSYLSSSESFQKPKRDLGLKNSGTEASKFHTRSNQYVKRYYRDNKLNPLKSVENIQILKIVQDINDLHNENTNDKLQLDETLFKLRLLIQKQKI